MAALPEEVDPVSGEVRAACAEAVPEPFLDTVEERWLGTGAPLRRLRAVSQQPGMQAKRTMRSAMEEPYRIDWALVTAARLGGRLPRTAAGLLMLRQDCPPEVAVVLRTGRPARPGQPLPSPAPAPPPSIPASGARVGYPSGNLRAGPGRSGRARSPRARLCGRCRSRTVRRTDRHSITSPR